MPAPRSTQPPHPARRAALPPLLTPLLLLGCVSHDPAPLDLELAAASAPDLPPGTTALPFATAVAFAQQHNPELQQLTATARAAGLDVPATELQGQYQGDRRMLAVMVDPLALLAIGQRGAQSQLASARAAEAAAALAVARWRLLGRIAELYAADRALASLVPPSLELDGEPFVRAGLASPQAAAQARAAVTAAALERATIASERAQLGSELRTLLGLRRGAPLQLTPLAACAVVAPTDTAATFRRRPDLALALASYDTADAEFRRAVTDQYPALMIGPEAPLRGGMLDVMAWLRWPVFAAGPARAARERRTAADAAVRLALQQAELELDRADRTHQLAELRAAAAAATAAASQSALAAAQIAVALESDAFDRLAERAQMAVRDAIEHRMATIEAARARVQLAVAGGWPAIAEEASR
ncbi:MAG: hypothetical protein MUC36_07805 [Planctomycetes bacterium]|jgi:hypothetical protein|nr:hypothetical protein [Planctomycetota bacterium]